MPDAAAPVVCRPTARPKVAKPGSQPYMYPASQDNRISISPVITSHAMQGLPPSLSPSFFPSSARLLVRSFVACFLWPLYSPPQLTVCSVLLPDRTEATEEGRGECKQRPRRGRGSKVLHNNTAACYTSFFTLRRGRRRADEDLRTTRGFAAFLRRTQK